MRDLPFFFPILLGSAEKAMEYVIALSPRHRPKSTAQMNAFLNHCLLAALHVHRGSQMHCFPYAVFGETFMATPKPLRFVHPLPKLTQRKVQMSL